MGTLHQKNPIFTASSTEIELRNDLPFKGKLLKVFEERNFGLVEVQRYPDKKDYSITFEIHCESRRIGIQRFPTV